ncbi:MAG: hypothetical protein H0T83_00820 [Chthoniobacterales bacterium]|nr:hypothetical protein [Chthoniobacterales bacterium]
MRSTLRFTLAFLILCAVPGAEAQSARPQFRPAVLKSGAESLINRIDTAALLKKGQKNGAVMFCVLVGKDGEATASWTYRQMPGTAALDEELTKKLEDTKFTTPLYDHQPVGVLLHGTAIFSAEETPHIRIFLNQDAREISAESDFISPQPVIGGDSRFSGLHADNIHMPILMTAVVDLGVKVDENGNMQNLRLLNEEPPLLGLGQAALSDLQGAKFIPAFRSGAATESDVVLPICYKPTPTQPAEQQRQE